MSPNVNTQRAEYLEYLNAKRESLIAIMRAKISLAEAEGDSDLIDIDEQIRQTQAHPGPITGKPTVEDLTRASKTVQQLESHLELIDQMGEQPGIGETMRPLIDAVMRPMIAAQLESAEDYRSRVQKALEEEPA